MPKKGKPDSYWEDLMHKYARGEYHFGTGQTPGSNKWKTILKAITGCPRHKKTNTADLFGKEIVCKCGYHKTTVQSEPGTHGTSGAMPGPSNPGPVSKRGPISPTSAQPDRSTKASEGTEEQIKCSQCAVEVTISKFSTHLSDHHAKVTCEKCNKVSLGNIAYRKHMKDMHSHRLSSVCHPPTVSQFAPRSGSHLHKVSTQHKPTLNPPSITPAVSQFSLRSGSHLHKVSTQHRPTFNPPSITAAVSSQSTHFIPHRPVTTPALMQTLTANTSVIAPSLAPVNPSTTIVQTQNLTSRTLPAQVSLLQTSAETSPSVTRTMSSPATGFIPHQRTIPPTPQQVSSTSSSHLPSQFTTVIQPGDVQWVSHVLYESNGRFRATFSHNWHEPPPPPKATVNVPDPHCYFRQRLFVWAPMRMWGIPLKCPECNITLTHGGIYPKAREVIDVSCRYYMVGEYVRCSKCKQPHCPWNAELLNQLDPAHRLQFPAVLTQQLALDKKVVSLMKPRTMGNSSSFLRQAVAELHSEEWGKRVLQYFGDCELHKRGCILTGASPKYQPPPAFRPPPLASLFETAHTNDVAGHIDQMKGVVTSTFGNILKLDSTKKITTKLAGSVDGSATWMSNVGNQRGEILNSVLTTGEGVGLQKMCQGIVKRYSDASEDPPELVYVDRDCCSQSGDIPVLKWFQPWRCHVRLDIWHFMRRFNSGLTTEHHPLYGTWCQRLSSCIFIWDKGDISKLKAAKRAELKDRLGREPSEQQVSSSLKATELARHCRRTTRGAEETRQLISKLIKEMGSLTDTMGTPLINAETMPNVWRVQQKHVTCIQDVPGVVLYTKTGTLQKGGHTLPIFRCGRGSTSLESFHRHQCNFIPGYRCNALHTQMYLLEGLSRWNINRGQQAVDAKSSSGTALYDLRLVANINDQSLRLLNTKILPEYPSYGKPTGEEIAVEYLLSQSGKGDLHPAAHQTESAPLDEGGEAYFEEEGDATVSTFTDPPRIIPLNQAGPSSQDDISSEDMTMPPPIPPLSPSSSPPPPAQEGRHDIRGNVGWEAVDDLAGYLVRLDRDKTALTSGESASIVKLYKCLCPSDRSPTKYSVKSNPKQPTGRWRVSRKPSGSAPGKQASERLYMVHGQAAETPDKNRISECLCLRLFKEFQLSRNRPLDIKGNRLPLPQAIVQAFSHIKQLVQDDVYVQENAQNLVLVTINNATVSSWLKKRDKRVGTAVLLQSTNLPEHHPVAEEPLPAALEQPSSPSSHSHNPMEFTEPTNMEGEVAPTRKRKTTTTTTQVSPSTSVPQWSGQWSASAMPRYQYGSPAWYNPAMMMPPWFQPPPWFQTPGAQPSNLPSQPQSTPSASHHQPPTSSQATPQSPEPGLTDAPSTSSSQPTLPEPPQPPHSYQFGSQLPPWIKPPAWFRPAPSEMAFSQVPQSQLSSTTQPSSEPPSQPSSLSRNREWRLATSAREDEERRARGEPPVKRYRKRELTTYKCTSCGMEKKSETGHTQLDGKWFCPSFNETLQEWKTRIYKCLECGETKSKDSGHIRHPKSRNVWYCPSSSESVDQWKHRVGLT